MSFTRPTDHIYGVQRDPNTPSPFGCLDCLLHDSLETSTYPLYQYKDTYLCANHVRKRKESEKCQRDLDSSAAKAFQKGYDDARVGKPLIATPIAATHLNLGATER